MPGPPLWGNRGAAEEGDVDQVPRSIEVLRQQARDELAAIIEHRCRAGEDPWHFIPDLPSVDEQVV
ncbi:hypothetical protein GWI34_44765, partial [Actinomadura sp. DSM 109109]|nr:hypothetical protein [Actinomadura lepetitiana]